MTEAYPLRWPPGRPRTRPEQRLDADIEASFPVAQRRAMSEVNLLHGRGPVLSLDLPRGPDGQPMRDHLDNLPADAGAALYFNLDGERYCVACDHCAGSRTTSRRSRTRSRPCAACNALAVSIWCAKR